MEFNFDLNFQQAVAGYMLKEKEFLIQSSAYLPASAFADPHVSKIVSIVYDYYAKYGDIVKSKEELSSIIRQSFYGDVPTANKHLEKMELMVATRDQFRFEVIKAHMTGWLKMMTLKSGIEKSAELYNKKQYDSLTGELTGLLNRVNNATFEGQEKFNLTDLKDFYEKYLTQQSANCCTIGHDDFDELMRPGSKIKEGRNPNDITTLTKGSLFPGQTTVIMGATNSGKTSMVTSIIVANILFGKYVYYCGHEQSAEELMDKCVKALTGLQGEELYQAVREGNPRVIAAQQYLSRYLHYRHWIKSDNMFVEPVIAEFKIANSKLRAETGRGFDLLVDDYPGKLKSKMYSNRAWKRHEELLYVYESFVNIVKEEKVHGIFPAQVNRDGYKVNKEGARPLDAGDAAGSYDLTHTVDNIITIGRTNNDVANNRMKFHLPKSRTASIGPTFVSKVNLGLSRTHGWDLPSKVFLPGSLPTDEACSLYFNDREIQQRNQEQIQADARMIAEMMSATATIDESAPLFLGEGE